ncbi:MAG: UPF0182 family protein [Armatimonadetes bacterium]|nr:UPF0182 family protein [Armatimonadota bacterium]
MRRYFWPIVIAIAALLLIFGGALVRLYTDWLWFKDLGYSVVFTKKLITQVGIGLVMGALFFALIYGNLWYARRIAPPPSPMSMEQQLLERLGTLARRGIGIVIFLGSIVISAMVALEAATHWEEWLIYSHATPFGVADPQFARDIGFYVFQLPFLNYIYSWLFFALAVATVATVALHYADEAIEVFGNRLQFAPRVKGHIAVLIAAMFFLKAWGYRLGMYQLLLGRGTRFDGASYADIHARLPALQILMVVAIIAGLLVLFNIYRRGTGYALAGLVGLMAAAIVVGGAYPALVQQYSVIPNEKDKEAPYITRAIAATQEAYGLGMVTDRPFAAESSLTPEQISANLVTIENIRLWDKDHLQAVYNQTQTIQQYYHFPDLDVDRYWLTDPNTGDKRYRQVWLGARELDQGRLAEGSRTWINEHLQYTHGYGYAMSPVNETDEQGKPLYIVKDIPPKTTVDIPIKEMGVYFGQLTENHAIVKTKAPEFDYPTAEETKTTSYKGYGGVRVGGFMRKLLFSLRFSDVNMLLNSSIKPTSRILFNREIKQRTEALLPFLMFDNDPYLVTVDGKLYWMRDGYTTTDSYPYSQHVSIQNRDLNYMRNSVKVVVDAYTGRVNAYYTDKPVADPIIRTYDRIFQGILKPISDMPAELQAHIRYPEDMFRAQTFIYTRYHYRKDRPGDFYNNADLWAIPNRADLTGASVSQGSPMEPYYIIMKLPNGANEEFILMTPYVRAGAERKNMVAWMCARCDAANYGRLVLYRFPENKNVYGPEQIAGLASQDPVISPQLSLWDQRGSQVGTGNLMVIPIENSLLYVMPVYLTATQTQMPQIVEVIVALGNKIAMRPTLSEALTAVVGAPVSSVPSMGTSAEGVAAPTKDGVTSKPGRVPGVPGAAPSAEVTKLVNQAVSQYEKAQNAQKAGDWAEYGRQVNALKATLGELQRKAK